VKITNRSDSYGCLGHFRLNLDKNPKLCDEVKIATQWWIWPGYPSLIEEMSIWRLFFCQMVGGGMNNWTSGDYSTAKPKWWEHLEIILLSNGGRWDEQLSNWRLFYCQAQMVGGQCARLHYSSVPVTASYLLSTSRKYIVRYCDSEQIGLHHMWWSQCQRQFFSFWWIMPWTKHNVTMS